MRVFCFRPVGGCAPVQGVLSVLRLGVLPVRAPAVARGTDRLSAVWPPPEPAVRRAPTSADPTSSAPGSDPRPDATATLMDVREVQRWS